MMSNVLVSPTEPLRIRALGDTSSVPERHGVDIMWWGRSQKWGVQRKEFPGDFTASLYDGRLTKELAQMADLNGGRALILEGYGTWTDAGELIARRNLSFAQLVGIMVSAAKIHGVQVLRVRDITETVLAVEALVRWSKKIRHTSLEPSRPRPRSKWGTLESEDWVVHLLTGFEGIGPELARNILDHFGGMPFRWNVEGDTVKALMEVPGIGKKIAGKLAGVLHTGGTER